ncbi:MAG: polysaccharide export protein [Deltaproteobacteria bacterium]|nr:polysaccharide export protein [Deltaproteobacteria bacterium]
MIRIVLVLLLALVSACRDNPPAVYPTVAPVDDSQLTLGPGDKIELVVYNGTRQSKATYVLDALGEIEVQYIGTVAAGQKTAKSVQAEIQTKLADGYLKDPIVSLMVVEINSRKLSVFGQVLKSGTIKFTPGMTITEAIAQSGGFSPMARKNMVKVTRQVSGKSEIYKLPVEMIAEGSRPNFPMMPGDEVFVPERPW